MHCASADDCTANGARAEFRQSHPHRHDVTFSFCWRPGATCSSKALLPLWAQGAEQSLKHNSNGSSLYPITAKNMRCSAQFGTDVSLRDIQRSVNSFMSSQPDIK